MKNNIFKMKPISVVLLLAGIGMAPTSSYAADLMAVEGIWTSSGGDQVNMWGFAADTGSCPTGPVDWDVGPQLTDADVVTGNLTVNLRNCLTQPVSIVIPGQPATFTPQTITDATGRVRVTAFTHEAPAGGSAVYNWTGVKSGTYLYQSGSHPAKQVQMGLYGALTIGSYPGTSGDVTLLYSEIDPALHATAKAATPLDYNPSYYLVNGSESTAGLIAGDTNQPTVLRLLNAGLDFHVPALNGGHFSLVAEDGNPYPFARQAYSASMPAGKTMDALWQPASAGNHVIYDRRGHGMVASLNVIAGVGAPVAAADNYGTSEDTTVSVLAPGVLANDDPLTTAVLVSAPSNGTLNSGLASDGSFSYTPNADFNGTDSFTYKANDGSLDSNAASVTITVAADNDSPVANGNAYDAIEATTLSVASPGILGNDTDIDDVTLAVTTAPVIPPLNGSVTLQADGSFTYTPTEVAPNSDSFVYEACDAQLACSTAMVSLNIIAQPNSAPVAVEDAATVQRNSLATFINLTANDSDVDGNLKDGNGNVASSQITVTTGGSSTRGGTVIVLTDGVNYTPKRNFRGTDTFNYTVKDYSGAVSNEVTVRVNVVR